MGMRVISLKKGSIFIPEMGVIYLKDFKKLNAYQNTKDSWAFLKIAIENIKDIDRKGGKIVGTLGQSSNISIKDLDKWGETDRSLEKYLKKYKEEGVFEMPLFKAYLDIEKSTRINIKKKTNEQVKKSLGDILHAFEEHPDEEREFSYRITKEIYKEARALRDAWIEIEMKKPAFSDRESFLSSLRYTAKNTEVAIKIGGKARENEDLPLKICDQLDNYLNSLRKIKEEAEKDYTKYKTIFKL